jgi:hypothetical protein
MPPSRFSQMACMADAHMNVLDPRRSAAQPFGRMLWTGAVIEVRRIHTLAVPHQCHSHQTVRRRRAIGTPPAVPRAAFRPGVWGASEWP